MKQTIKITLASIFFYLSYALCAADVPGAWAAIQQPAAGTTPQINLISTDHFLFEIPLPLAHTSRTMHEMLEDKENHLNGLHINIDMQTLVRLIPLWNAVVSGLPIIGHLENLGLINLLTICCAANYLKIPPLERAGKRALLSARIIGEFCANPTLIYQFPRNPFIHEVLMHFSHTQHSLQRYNPGETSDLTRIAITPDGATLVSAMEKLVRIWYRQADGTYRHEVLPSVPSPMIDYEPGTQPVAPEYGANISALAISPDGALVVCSDIARIRIWQRQEGGSYTHQAIDFGFNETSGPIGISEDKSTIVISDQIHQVVLKRHPNGSYEQTSELVLEDEHAGLVGFFTNYLTVSTDGMIITGIYGRHIIVWHEEGHNTPDAHYVLRSVTARNNDNFIPSATATRTLDGSTAIVDRTNPHNVQLHSSNGNFTLQHDQTVAALALTPDKKICVCGYANGTIIIWHFQEIEVSFMQHLLLILINNSPGNIVDLAPMQRSHREVLMNISRSCVPGSWLANYFHQHVIENIRNG